jgi:Flp pilus assembly protein CpaB
MKKNLVPLLGIAFVVAIISTAIFYGLVSSRMSSEVQAKTDVAQPASQDPKASLASTSEVPLGMRAVSVQVADSSGVLALLKPGHRVDIQAVYNRGGLPVDSELKTVLQGIEVLKVNPQPEASPGRHALPVVTFLTLPADADVLALADSSARIRLALRHPEDPEKNARNTLGLGQLVRAPRPVSRQTGSAPALRVPVKAPEGGACAPQQSPLNAVPQ